MLNPFKDVNWNPGPAEKRKFAVSLVIGFPIVAAVFFLLRRMITGQWNPVPPLWIGVLGLGVGLLLLALPAIARPFYVIWYFLGCCIGIVVGNVLFAVFYFLVVTLLGWLMRAFGRYPLRKRFDRRTATYWRDAERVTDPKRYYRQF
jgi:hypothetical protein